MQRTERTKEAESKEKKSVVRGGCPSRESGEISQVPIRVRRNSSPKSETQKLSPQHRNNEMSYAIKVQQMHQPLLRVCFSPELFAKDRRDAKNSPTHSTSTC